MEDQKHTTSFKLKKESVLSLANFLSGGCEWVANLFRKGDYIEDDHLCVYLCFGNPESLPLGCERRATFSFAVLNQSLKELYRLDEPQEKGFLKKNNLILKVEVTGKEMLDFNGFQVLYSQVPSVTMLLIKHPEDIAGDFRPKKKLVKAAYMNDLLGIIGTLNKPPHSLSKTDLSDFLSVFIELKEEVFKLDWLKEMLAKECKAITCDNVDDTRVQECEVFIKTMLAKECKAITCDARDCLEGVVDHSWELRVGFADVGKEKKDWFADVGKVKKD